MADAMQALRRLLSASHRAAPEDLPALAHQVAGLFDADDIVIYLVDYGQTSLVPLAVTYGTDTEAITIEGTLAGRSFSLNQVLEATTDTGHRLWVPLLDGTERLGLLEVLTGAAPSAGQREDLQTVANLLAELLMTRRLYGDAIELTRRRQPMQLAAEILWNLLPPLTFVTDRVAVSAILEPCYDVGGDAFDYAVNGTVLHVAIFDAVGHGLDASAVTSLVINAYRNARRSGLDLAGTYRSIDRWIGDKHPDSFVTALLLELDTERGVLRRISAGHPGELLLRNGRLVRTLTSPTAMPLGIGYLGDPVPGIDEVPLQPGDQLLLYTDGVTEGRTLTGEFFGVQRLAGFVTRALADRLPAPETMRRLVHAILAHQDNRLRDDATAVLVEWQPAAAPTADMPT